MFKISIQNGIKIDTQALSTRVFYLNGHIIDYMYFTRKYELDPVF